MQRERFFGGKIDELQIDLFRIQKKIDVKKLKLQLWNYIDPQVKKIVVDHHS